MKNILFLLRNKNRETIFFINGNDGIFKFEKLKKKVV